MNDSTTGKLTILEVPQGEEREALIDYLVKSQKSVSREKLSERIGRLPLVLGRNIPGHLAGRIVADMEALGAKMLFTPTCLQEEEAHSEPAAGQAPPRSFQEILLAEAFSDAKIHFPVSPLYQAGLLLVSLAMILLPIVYLGIVGGAAYLLYWHATANLHVFTTVRSARGALFIYVTPLIVGALLIFFLIKPLFARHAGTHRYYPVHSSEEPLLFAFIEKVCATVGAPMPSSVRMDTQVNASAGFPGGILSLFGRDLVLTIGLPLARGLNLSEFGGVLAHEFGHFAQSSGMRLSYIIRSINYWFSRVVYEEDVFDVRLRIWSRAIDFRLGFILWIARFFIWLGKKVLFLLMKVGHLIGCFVLRQMEFDADKYEAALVGADVFESTCDKLGPLAVAHSQAFQDLDRLWEEGRLADNLPELVVGNFYRMNDETKASIRSSRTAIRTKAFDTHPSDTDRITSVRTISCTPVFSWPDACWIELPGIAKNVPRCMPSEKSGVPPATTLFRDFSALSKQVTLDHYRQVLGILPGSKGLVDVGAMVQSQSEEQNYFEALERYFLGRFTPWLPLGVEAMRLSAPADPSEALREVKELRERILRRHHRHGELVREFMHLIELMIHAARARVLIETGFTINPGDFALPGAAINDVVEVEKRHVEREKNLLKEVNEVNRLYLERLILGLQLLQQAPIGERSEKERERLRTEGEAFLQTMDALEFQFPLFRKLHLDSGKLTILAQQITENENNETLMKAIRQWMETVRQDLGFLRERMGENPYPFDHARPDMTLGLFIVESDLCNCNLGELLSIAQSAIERMLRTYSRLAARLARAAEEVEKIYGLSPLK